MRDVILITFTLWLHIFRFTAQLLLFFFYANVKREFPLSRETSDINASGERIPPATRNLKFVGEIRASLRRSMRQIRAPSNLRMLEQLLRASFAASSASSHLPHDCSRSMRRGVSAPRRAIPLRSVLLRNMRGGFARARGRRGRTGRPTSRRTASRQRVPSAAPSVCVCLGSRHPRLHVVLRSRLSASCTRSNADGRRRRSPSWRGTPAIVTRRSQSIDQSHVNILSFRFSATDWSGGSLKESSGVPGWPENSQNSPRILESPWRSLRDKSGLC